MIFTEAAPSDGHRDARRGGDTERVDGELVLVDVSLLLEDVVQVPDLDAPVDGGGDDLVVGADHQGLDLHDPLEVGRHPLDEGPVLHVPDQQLLPYPSHGQLVALGEDDVGGGVEPLGNVPHTVWQLQLLDLVLRYVPEDEPIQDSSTAPLLVLNITKIRFGSD